LANNIYTVVIKNEEKKYKAPTGDGASKASSINKDITAKLNLELTKFKQDIKDAIVWALKNSNIVTTTGDIAGSKTIEPKLKDIANIILNSSGNKDSELKKQLNKLIGELQKTNDIKVSANDTGFNTFISELKKAILSKTDSSDKNLSKLNSTLEKLSSFNSSISKLTSSLENLSKIKDSSTSSSPNIKQLEATISELAKAFNEFKSVADALKGSKAVRDNSDVSDTLNKLNANITTLLSNRIKSSSISKDTIIKGIESSIKSALSEFKICTCKEIQKSMS
jgi:hypothetical protein